MRLRSDGFIQIPNLGGNGNQYVGSDNNGFLYKITPVCDRRLKQNIKQLDCAICKIEKLEIYKYKYKPSKVIHKSKDEHGEDYIITDRPEISGYENYGVMAQELLEAGLEDCVGEEETKLGEKYYTLNEKKLQWYFNKATQSLIKKNRELESRLESLESLLTKVFGILPNK